MDGMVTERLLLRRWSEEDREPFRRMNADPRVMEYFQSTLAAEMTDALMERNARHFEEHGFGLWAAELRTDRSFVGFVGLATVSADLPFAPAVEIGWRLAASCWGKGLATEGAKAVVQYAFEEAGLEGLVSYTAAANLRSRRVMEKVGMVHSPEDDFEHPRIAEGHWLRPHVLYRLGTGSALQTEAPYL
jgi:RimJ/RimL family protein N-acetyltransferase